MTDTKSTEFKTRSLIRGVVRELSRLDSKKYRGPDLLLQVEECLTVALKRVDEIAREEREGLK